MKKINDLKKGSLVIVGTGILTPAHLSQESVKQIEVADIVHVLVPDPLGLSTIQSLNSNIKNLADLYFDETTTKNGCNRLEAYDLMVEAILEDVRLGNRVCAIFYGHPGVFVYPSHVSIEKAKSEGFAAKMLPAISAEDCLFADLAFDPGDNGCQAYEASQFLFYQHSINVNALLILWQIGVVGDETLTKLTPAENGLEMLREGLLDWYPKNHQVILYEATRLPIMPARIEYASIDDLPKLNVQAITTLVIPAIAAPQLDHNFCDKWRINKSRLS